MITLNYEFEFNRCIHRLSREGAFECDEELAWLAPEVYRDNNVWSGRQGKKNAVAMATPKLRLLMRAVTALSITKPSHSRGINFGKKQPEITPLYQESLSQVGGKPILEQFIYFRLVARPLTRHLLCTGATVDILKGHKHYTNTLCSHRYHVSLLWSRSTWSNPLSAQIKFKK